MIQPTDLTTTLSTQGRDGNENPNQEAVEQWIDAAAQAGITAAVDQWHEFEAPDWAQYCGTVRIDGALYRITVRDGTISAVPYLRPVPLIDRVNIAIRALGARAAEQVEALPSYNPANHVMSWSLDRMRKGDLLHPWLVEQLREHTVGGPALLAAHHARINLTHQEALDHAERGLAEIASRQAPPPGP
ncbi:hypothetical protein [Streptosporangium sp. CA-115845]|uniref:hypothetical protein n=1 Tax=Streptosporangium sp. CA-115845 TaxID=3240071 RepID=UPI003D8E702B